MKRILTVFLTFCISVSFGQTNLSDKFKALYEAKKFNKIISYKPQKGEELNSKALYYIAMSYYMEQQDDMALKYFDKALKKGPVDHDMYYYKGKTLFYTGKYQESLGYFDKSIEMLPDEPDFYGGKGEAFEALGQKDSALYYYNKAMTLPDCNTDIYFNAGSLYQEIDDLKGALATFEVGLTKIPSSSKDYNGMLFNVGLMNQLTGNFEKANEVFELVILNNPEDFHTMAKLVQTYYALDKMEDAKPYRLKLYEAHSRKELPEKMEEMFCFDQFNWNGKRVMAFERFEESDSDMFVKHHFYVLNESGDIDYRIDSESSLSIRMARDDAKYVLCLVKDQTHQTYWHYIFNDNYDYKELKKAVTDILENKVEPGATFIPGKKKN